MIRRRGQDLSLFKAFWNEHTGPQPGARGVGGHRVRKVARRRAGRDLELNRKAAAMATATTRSLNDQVGFMVSFLMYREDKPNTRPNLAARSSGVKPGDRSISGTRLTGRSGSYRQIDGGPDSIIRRNGCLASAS